MADTSVRKTGWDGSPMQSKLKDLGSGNFAESVYVENVSSQNLILTVFEDTDISGLKDQIDTYVASSAYKYKELIITSVFNLGLLIKAILIEVND